MNPGVAAKIESGDALELVQVTETGLDLVVTDPPYAFGGTGAEHELSAVVAVVLRECAARLKRDRAMVVLCASSARSIRYMMDAVRPIVEPVRIGTWAKPHSRTKVQTAGWRWASVAKSDCALLDHIIAEPVLHGRRAQLPESVADWAVSPFAVPGGRFLDPFAGSGALVHAAHRAGMHATGFEINPAQGAPPGSKQ